MSRIGAQPVVIPSGVNADIQGRCLTVKGPKGELAVLIHPRIIAQVNDGAIVFTARGTSVADRALWGTHRAIAANLVKGVTEGYSKRLLIEGVGYRATLKGKDIELALGFSHPVPVKAPEGITFAVEKNAIIVSGISKELVGNVTASIRALKKPEPYKGKGIRYDGEIIRRKAGKKAAGATG